MHFEVGNNVNHAKCTVCSTNFVISHGGWDDVEKLVETEPLPQKRSHSTRSIQCNLELQFEKQWWHTRTMFNKIL